MENTLKEIFTLTMPDEFKGIVFSRKKNGGEK
jgi:hypothetical protein